MCHPVLRSFKFTQFLLGVFLIALLCSHADSIAQPSKKPREEKEEGPITPKGNPAETKTPTEPSKASLSAFIAAAATKEKNQAIKAFLQRIAIPFDYLHAAKDVRPYAIALYPDRQLPDGNFSYLLLRADLIHGERKELRTAAGLSLEPYEEIVLGEVDRLLDPARAVKEDLGIRDYRVQLCVEVLQEVRRQHAAWLENKTRVGKVWEPVDGKLRRKIIQLRKEQLRASVDDKIWRRADELAQDLGNFIDDAEAKTEIYRYVLKKAIASVRTDHDEDYAAVRDAVAQYAPVADPKDANLVASARRMLSDKANQYVKQAARHIEKKDATAAYRLLKNAEAIDPTLPEIKQLRGQFRDRVLYVGVPRLPEKMSPATAGSDAERAAGDLLFESLLQAIPDEELGRRYRPALASSLPTLVPLGRDFTLTKNARWNGDGGKPLDARDVLDTLELFKNKPHLPGAEAFDVLDIDRTRIEDPLRIRLGFRQGLLEPLDRTTFKVLPARYLKGLTKEADDSLFAKQPFGSGPYQYQGREQEGPEREVAVFRANPNYGTRSNKFGLPNIPEIRFVVPKQSSLGADFAGGHLHMVLDVPTAEIARYRDDPSSTGQVNVFVPSVDRRIHMLAINHHTLPLRNVELRRGISAAIDREAILQNVFRPDSATTYHRALAGPFPLNCWATPEKARKPEAALFNKNLAGGLLAAAAGKEKIALTLVFSQDDPLASRACERIKEQIEAAAKKTPADQPLVEIDPVGVPGDQFWWRIMQQQSFDLAYLPYDYKNDLYWLGHLLDRNAAVAGGRNFMSYLAPGTNPAPDDNDLRVSLDAIRAHRDFGGKYREETWKVHAKFLARMPFVPLWQLDRHIAIHQSVELHLDGPADKVKPESLDPAAIFNGVEYWRLK